MTINQQKHWSAAERIVSSMLCEMKTFGEQEQHALGTLPWETKRAIQEFSEISVTTAIEELTRQGAAFDIWTPPSYEKAVVEKVTATYSEEQDATLKKNCLLRYQFRSVWDTAHNICILTRAFIENPEKMSLRSIFSLQRDLVDKTVDIPFALNAGKTEAKRHYDYLFVLGKFRMVTARYLRNIKNNLSKNPVSSVQSDLLEAQKLCRHSLAVLERAFIDTYHPELSVDSSDKAKKARRDAIMSEWTVTDIKKRVKSGIQPFLDKDYYNLTSIGLKTDEVKEYASNLPTLHHQLSDYVHDRIPNYTYISSGKWEENHTDVEIGWQVLGVTTFALCVAAAHYYDCAGQKQRLQILLDIIDSNRIEGNSLIM